jgi:peptidoglycan/LPS O-acetylase OafA/YrhL
MHHRDDIDGLRAISVSAVVLYHAAPSWAPGGFLGVDIFFVISGFLITRLIHDEILGGRFSIWHFYQRRIRRIIPALVVVCAVTTALALVLMFPSDLAAYSANLMSAMAFVANIKFYHDDIGYFAAQAELKTLLHLWSLSVEEQFYVVFPIIVIVATRYRCLLAVLVGIGAASFVAWAIVRRIDPSAAFYLLPYRAWELMLGGAVAVGLKTWRPTFPVATILAAAGLAAIIHGVLRFNPNNSTIISTCLPCLGAASLLAASTNHALRPILENRPIVFLGLISYSLYLWHWPLLSLARYYLMVRPSPWMTALIIALSLAAAALSWRFIEQPFRRGGLWPARNVAIAAAASMLTLTLGAGLINLHRGLPSRFAPDVIEMATTDFRTRDDFLVSLRTGQCFMRPDQGPIDFDSKSCLGQVENAKSVMLWGDSYAAHFYSGLRAVLEGRPIHVIQATASSCPPILALDVNLRPHCRALNDYFFAWIAASRPSVVVLSAVWAGFAFPPRTKFDDPEPSIDATIAKLKSLGVTVVLLGPTPIYDVPLPLILAHRLQFGEPRDPSALIVPTVFKTERDMQLRYAKNPKVTYISMTDLLCTGTLHCAVTNEDGLPVHLDTGHLSIAGSRLVAERLMPKLLAAIEQRPGAGD